jgi:hypothetical protein
MGHGIHAACRGTIGFVMLQNGKKVKSRFLLPSCGYFTK